jgi:hypothetical protein
MRSGFTGSKISSADSTCLDGIPFYIITDTAFSKLLIQGFFALTAKFKPEKSSPG